MDNTQSTLHVPEVDNSVVEAGTGSLAHCLVATQWGTPATCEYAVISCRIAAQALFHVLNDLNFAFLAPDHSGSILQVYAMGIFVCSWSCGVVPW